jgi:hypothetical protein
MYEARIFTDSLLENGLKADTLAAFPRIHSNLPIHTHKISDYRDLLLKY